MSLYNRRRRLLTELAIVVLGTINAGLIINYCVQVRRAPVAPQWLDEGDRFLPAKRSLSLPSLSLKFNPTDLIEGARSHSTDFHRSQP